MKTPVTPGWSDWAKACDVIRGELAPVSYDTWIKPLVPLVTEDNRLYVLVQAAYMKNIVEARYSSMIANALYHASGKNWEIILVLEDEAKKLTAPPQENAENGLLMLNPKNTFETFVIGNSNRFAHAASLAVAEAPALAYNPLFIYGGVGLGKTHLMQAIGHFIRQANPQMQIIYVTSEMFMNDLINAIRTNTNEEFRARYRKADVLMIDDVQLISGKVQTEEELFHTFNTLREANKQIVLSSDKPPRELKQMTERLRSRFEWGLTADIQPPDFETRIAILRQKAEAENAHDIPDEVMECIAGNSENNIRELEGTLNRVLAYAKLTRMPVTVELVHEAIKDVITNSSSHKTTPENIMKLVCERYSIPMSEFLSRRRNQDIAYPRKIAMYLVRELTDMPLAAIGEIFGRDHSTVLHAWRTISEESATNINLRTLLADLRNRLIDQQQ